MAIPGSANEARYAAQPVMASRASRHARTRLRPTPSGRLLDWAAWLVLAGIAYVPSFLTQPGKIAADTKQYLYLDPGRVISSAISMWNPDVGAGTVTHENIGYLFPMGPYYWVVQQLGIPMWIGQRFWMGTLFFAAGTGAWKLCRLLGVNRTGQAAAALAYMLSPFVIDDIARQSGVITPWAALGWFMCLTVLAVRKGGWRYPALFAIVVALVGGVNATSILLVGLAPLLWLLYAAFITKEAPGRAVTQGGAADRAPVAGHVVVVDSRAVGRRGLRHQHPQVHRDPADGLGHLAGLRGDPGPRVLVLLRPGQAAALDSRLPRLHPVALADRREFRRAGHLLPVRHVGPLALPGVRHRPRRPRRGGRRRRLPLHQPHPARKPDQDGRLGFDGRSGHALVQPDRAGGDPRAGPAVGIRDLRHPPVGALGRAGRPGALGRPVGRQSPAVVGRHPGGLQPGSAFRPAQLHHRRRPLSRRAEPRHPGARGTRRGLRLLHLGRRSRPGLARAHDPLLPDQGGPTTRRAGHRQPPAGPRRVDPRRTVRALHARSHRPALLRRRHPLRVRCAVRAL